MAALKRVDPPMELHRIVAMLAPGDEAFFTLERNYGRMVTGLEPLGRLNYYGQLSEFHCNTIQSSARTSLFVGLHVLIEPSTPDMSIWGR